MPDADGIALAVVGLGHIPVSMLPAFAPRGGNLADGVSATTGQLKALAPYLREHTFTYDYYELLPRAVYAVYIALADSLHRSTRFEPRAPGSTALRKPWRSRLRNAAR